MLEQRRRQQKRVRLAQHPPSPRRPRSDWGPRGNASVSLNCPLLRRCPLGASADGSSQHDRRGGGRRGGGLLEQV